jgi:hypothetical protein
MKLESEQSKPLVYMSGSEMSEQVRKSYQPYWLVCSFVMLIFGMAMWGMAR